MKKTLKGLLAMAILGASFSAAAARIYVRLPPPPIKVEVRGTAPSRHHVWVTGYHAWDGNAYVWTPGRWEEPPRRHAHWRAGHWRHDRRHGWYWVEGHWR